MGAVGKGEAQGSLVEGDVDQALGGVVQVCKYLSPVSAGVFVGSAVIVLTPTPMGQQSGPVGVGCFQVELIVQVMSVLEPGSTPAASMLFVEGIDRYANRAQAKSLHLTVDGAQQGGKIEVAR